MTDTVWGEASAGAGGTVVESMFKSAWTGLVLFVYNLVGKRYFAGTAGTDQAV